MRFLFAAVIAFAAMTIDFETGFSRDTNFHKTQDAFTVARGEAEDELRVVDSSIGTMETFGSTETRVASATNDSVPETEIFETEQLPKKQFCEALREAAEASSIPIAFFARLLWQESRFQFSEVSRAGAQGIAQFMPATAAEVGLDDPFDPYKALPASAKFLRKLHDEFGNLGLAAAAYNAGSGRIQKWLSGRGELPQETRNYVRTITGNAAENWLEETKTVGLRSELPRGAPCEGVGGLSRTTELAAVPVALASSISDTIRKAAAEARRAAAAKLQAAAEAKTRVALLLRKKISRKNLASTSAGETAGAQSATAANRQPLHTALAKRSGRARTKAAARSRQSDET